MEYGKTISRSITIVWENKFLILLGILVAIGSGSFGSGAGGGGGGGGGGSGTGDFGQFSDIGEEVAALAAGLIIALVCVLILVALVFWVISLVARGGLIAGVDAIESGQKSSFRQAWGAGWQKVWRLVGISLIPAIAGLILFLVGLMAFGAFGAIFAVFGAETPEILVTGGITAAVLICIFGPIVLVLSILRNFAERACMLEDLGVFDSYRRGWQVLTGNLGEAIVLFLLQIGITIILGFFFFLPGLVLVLCCFLWPLLLAIQGGISAILSALWTLAWRTWTGGPPMVEKEPATA